MTDNQLDDQVPQTQLSFKDQSHSLSTTDEKKIPKPVLLEFQENRKRYGNVIVLMEKPFLFCIGPDYLCFLGGFSFFAALAYFLCITVRATFETEWVILFTYSLSILQCGSYLLIAFSNPGISLPENNPIKEYTTENVHLVCKKCGAESLRKTYHCRDCDVCIKGYDHHCPWTSKCIGQNNLYRFYLFVTVTPIYILTFMAMMFGCLIVSAQKANLNSRTHLTTNS